MKRSEKTLEISFFDKGFFLSFYFINCYLGLLVGKIWPLFPLLPYPIPRKALNDFFTATNMIDVFQKSIDDGHISAAVLIDISKVFDTIDHA